VKLDGGYTRTYSGKCKHCAVYRNVFRQETIIGDVRGKGEEEEGEVYVDRIKVL
jgi:hypothetical protein